MTTATETIAGVSVSHERAGVEQLETVSSPTQREAVDALLDAGATEAYVLQTCNRVEGYVVADTEREGLALLADLVADAPEEVVVEMGQAESLRHLLRVAAGLESLVLGEDQIIGQVRDAYEDARRAGGIGPMLEDGVTKAIRVGERARTETAVNEGVVSLGSAAVRMVSERDSAPMADALVVGAGEMGTRAAKALGKRADSLVVANRTRSRARRVTDQVDCESRAVGLDALPTALARADVVVSATGSDECLLDRDVLADAGETFVVDLGQPRDVAPPAAALAGVTVRDLDDLTAVTAKTRRRRQQAAEHVERIIDEEFDNLLTQYKRKRADRVISAMYESAERVKAAELNRATRSLDADLSADDRAVLESMADSIVSQLLAAPTDSLRDAAAEDDWSTINTALRLFDPDFGPDATEPPDFVSGLNVADIPEEMREEMPAAVLDQLEE